MPSAGNLPSLLIVTPYLAAANNGNWRTAARWARLLARHYRTIVQAAETPVTGGRRDQAEIMIGLHARRSRLAIAAWREAYPRRPLLVALTGTDLYRDVSERNSDALASLADADRLIVLQGDAKGFVPARWRSKVDVIYQSARRMSPWARKAAGRLHCVLVAHLRSEKDPETAFAAWRRLPREAPITLTIIGDALDAGLGEAARSLAAADRRVRWLGPRPQPWTRQAIKRAHVLLCPSRMEGGANVVVEAITAETAVVASRMSGNLGMLGEHYEGYFPVGSADALAALLESLLAQPALLAHLTAQCNARAPLFSPEAERHGLLQSIAAARAAIEPNPGLPTTVAAGPVRGLPV